MPANVDFDDEHYGFWVLVEQIRRFGPFEERFEEIASPERLATCSGAIDYICENRKWRPFSRSEDEEELLGDEWFRE